MSKPRKWFEKLMSYPGNATQAVSPVQKETDESGSFHGSTDDGQKDCGNDEAGEPLDDNEGELLDDDPTEAIYGTEYDRRRWQ